MAITLDHKCSYQIIFHSLFKIVFLKCSLDEIYHPTYDDYEEIPMHKEYDDLYYDDDNDDFYDDFLDERRDLNDSLVFDFELFFSSAFFCNLKRLGWLR